jgi:hypothetical protein
MFAADVRAGEREMFAQKIDQRRARFHHARLDYAVDLDFDRDERVGHEKISSFWGAGAL